jgi:hypothetical protein
MKFTTFDVQKKLGINRNTTQQLMDSGFIKPSIRAEGRGTKNLFTLSDLYRVVFFQKLTEAGIPRLAASGIAFTTDIEKSLCEGLTFYVLTRAMEYIGPIKSSLTHRAHGEGQLQSGIDPKMFKDNVYVCVINLEAIKEMVDDAVRE